MLQNIRRYNTTITVFTTADLNKEIQVRLSSSSSLAKMNTLKYDDIDKTKYKEVCRINGSLYQTGPVKACGWEISDVHKQACSRDGWYEVIQYKNGMFRVGDISVSDVNLNDIEWAYSVDAVVINNGQDVCQCASHRKQYFDQRHPRTFWGITANGDYVFCCADGRETNEAGLLGDEVRAILKEYGCVWGFMNDGGKCSQMMIDNKLVNDPVTGGYYEVRNALFVYASIADKPQNNGTSSLDQEARIHSLEVEIEQLREQVKNLETVIASIRTLVA